MIIGIGVDIVEVQELEQRLARESFLNVFSDRERAYADRLPAQRAEILAGRWAAKEAFLKAIGSGWRVEYPMREIEVVHDDPGGRPTLELGPAVRSLLPEGTQTHCSLSHTRGVAVACVIIEGERPPA